jgi:hypothetical protein
MDSREAKLSHVGMAKTADNNESTRVTTWIELPENIATSYQHRAEMQAGPSKESESY